MRDIKQKCHVSVHRASVTNLATWLCSSSAYYNHEPDTGELSLVIELEFGRLIPV